MKRFTYWLNWKLPWNVRKDRRMAQQWHDYFVQTTRDIRCSCCHRAFDIMDTGWRTYGSGWEHKCPENDPQAGYFPSEAIAEERTRE